MFPCSSYIDTRHEPLADAMRLLLKDAAQARAIGEAGRRMAWERFHIDRFVRDWERVLRRVVG